MSVAPRPIPAETIEAEKALVSKIQEIMRDRHGVGMEPVVEETLELVWPTLLERLVREVESLGGLGEVFAPAVEGASRSERIERNRVIGKVVCASSKSVAALGLPGFGRLDLRRGVKSADPADPEASACYLTLRLHTQAVRELRETLADGTSVLAEEPVDLFA